MNKDIEFLRQLHKRVWGGKIANPPSIAEVDRVLEILESKQFTCFLQNFQDTFWLTILQDNNILFVLSQQHVAMLFGKPHNDILAFFKQFASQGNLVDFVKHKTGTL